MEKIIENAGWAIGFEAFKVGKTSVPVHDKKLMEYLELIQDGGFTKVSAAIKGWSRGWHSANVKLSR